MNFNKMRFLLSMLLLPIRARQLRKVFHELDGAFSEASIEINRSRSAWRKVAAVLKRADE